MSCPKLTLAVAIAWLLFLRGVPASAAEQPWTFQHDDILGTSLELHVQADSAEAARTAERAVLQEIERLAGILSGYDPASEFRRWQAAAPGEMRVSGELLDVLEACSRWRNLSGKAFNPAVEALSQLWETSARKGRVPTAEELSRARLRADAAAWQVDRLSSTVRSVTDCPLSLNALAKGYIIDRAGQAALESSRGIRGLMLNIGGDLRVCGEMSTRVGIADPWRDSLTTRPVQSLELREAALATSGNYQRGFTVNGRKFSHVIDPRSGWPADQIVSASVVAPCATDADAIATICCVLSLEESLALVRGLPGVECLIVGQDGRIAQSEGWSGRELPTAAQWAVADTAPAGAAAQARNADRGAGAASGNRGFELEVNFELNGPTGGRSFARPYVAIWVEDQDGLPIRTLVLWVWNSGPGPQWIPDLRRWYRADRLRRLAEETDLVDTISRATRPPGKYKAIWDGKDDHGKLVAAGEYTLLIEAVREHGTYQIISQKIKLGDVPFTEELKGNAEIKSASIDYHRKPADR